MTNLLNKLNEMKNETECNTVMASVINWVESQLQDYDNDILEILSDLQQGGCESGFVSELIYYNDIEQFYNQHEQEIIDIANNYGLDTDDQSQLVWAVFELNALDLFSQLETFQLTETVEKMTITDNSNNTIDSAIDNTVEQRKQELASVNNNDKNDKNDKVYESLEHLRQDYDIMTLSNEQLKQLLGL